MEKKTIAVLSVIIISSCIMLYSVALPSIVAVSIPAASDLTSRISFNDNNYTALYPGSTRICGDHYCTLGEYEKMQQALAHAQMKGKTGTTAPSVPSTTPTTPSAPIKKVTANNTGLSDNSMAKSFVVHFKGDRGNFDVHTISKITQFGQKTYLANIQSSKVSGAIQFQFESIPSKNSKKYYDLISYYVNTGGSNKDLTDVNIDIIAVDGSTIETIQYGGCQVTSYYVYINDNKDQYRFLQNDVAELRDDANFACVGLQIVTPQTPHG